ncbi:hypothetical protein [Streptomyces sp. SID13726]|uniref:hypothetical protein n=1 Tax=Streptomyces sp. SID13726 TaxID=2706058 RepID=UPI0013B700D0|nr:hypothetical protein [Streptomyces sp. SID13726]NEB00625.1 hypothetical protein [Streptomyces sp. SID13726]
MTIPELIQVVRNGSSCRVFVDGEELPASISRDDGALIVDVHPDTLPTVTVKLQAHRVDVVNDVADEAAVQSLLKDGPDGA